MIPAAHEAGQRPFDEQFAAATDAAAIGVTRELGAVATFVASDEISVAFSALGQRYWDAEPAPRTGT